MDGDFQAQPPKRGTRTARLSELDVGLGSPLEAALAQWGSEAMSLVERALDRGDTKLAFQPAMRSDGRGVAFYEGLIRVLDDTGRVIPAQEFLGNVEDLDLGRRIDCAALITGLRALKSNPDLRLAINMSARSIGYPKWMSILRRFSRDHPSVIERMILEINESSAMQMPEIVAVFIEEYSAKGVTFTLDDFGAGTTAFRHLKGFCFDILKIDGQFARNVDQDADNQVMTEALICLAGHLDMLVVAESVETEAEAAWLQRAGVDCMQGYYFAVPTLTPPWEDPGPN